MAQTKIIVDTNSYLRLAQNIHPLLGVPFGKKENTLYMHADLNAEFRASSRLQSKFQWACEPDFVDNRRRPLSLSKKQKTEIEETFEYMWSFVQDEFHRKRQKGPSRTDTKIIATAATLEIRVVTDDQDMIERIVEQWQYENDTPNANWKEEYRRLFEHDPPKD